MNLGADAGNNIAVQTDEIGEEVRNTFFEFLTEFKSEEDLEVPDYVDQVGLMIESDRSTLYVDFHHLLRANDELAEAVEEEFARLEQFVTEAVKLLVQRVDPEYVYTEEQASGKRERMFFCSFYNIQGIQKLRDLTTNKIGRLMAISGTVTRTSEVRPELLKARFRCLMCGMLSDYVEQQFCYTEPRVCEGTAAKPRTCPNTAKWELVASSAIFCDWQKVRLQEDSKDIPGGSMPRSLNVIMRSEAVDKAKAGDKCVFVGTLIVTPDISQFNLPGVKARAKPSSTSGRGEGTRGLKGLGVRDLTYSMCFLASNVRLADQGHDAVNMREDEEGDVVLQLSDEEQADIFRMSRSPTLYKQLMMCVAPTVHGHDEVKRGILLMLMGGVHKTTPDEGISLRGDINVCIVGDPSTSKSQMLKWVTRFMPRAIFTSGKASSAAGLTATVAKDPDTGEFTIEAGALMLADNGICCIDEFDKMDVKDQVAIHEAMEQQSISIAKAGIQATLNARTSVLAAANPIGGRYDKSKTLNGNLNISAPIMSRFDLFFIVLDEMDEQIDYRIAQHIVRVHQYQDNAVAAPYTSQQLANYIKFARTLKPVLTEEAGQVLVEEYSSLRQNDVGAGGKTAYRITVRQLESLIRLSEALARLHLSPQVLPDYVREAARLLKKSIIHVETEDLVLRERLGPALETLEEEEEDQEDEAAAATPKKKKKKKGKVRITFENYTRISNLLVIHLRSLEDRGEAGAMKRQDLEEWYLQECALESVQALAEEARLIRMVIDRLIHKDHILMLAEAPEEEQEEQEEEKEEGEEEEEKEEEPAPPPRQPQQRDVWLSVNPNYSIG